MRDFVENVSEFLALQKIAFPDLAVCADSELVEIFRSLVTYKIAAGFLKWLKHGVADLINLAFEALGQGDLFFELFLARLEDCIKLFRVLGFFLGCFDASFREVCGDGDG